MSDDIRVLIVDDHAMLRAGFRTILSSQPGITVVGEAGTGAAAVDAAASLAPHVITMDVQMPDMDGLEATRRITANARITAAIAIVTTFDDDEYLFAALDAGATGFLLKNAGPEALISAVRALAAGDGMLAPEVTQRVLQRFGERRANTTGAQETRIRGTETEGNPAAFHLTEDLTERETEVLQLVAGAKSNAEIAAQLYIAEATVKTHVSRILQKLGARDRVQAVVVALRNGLA